MTRVSIWLFVLALFLFPAACVQQGTGSKDVRPGPSEVTVLNVDGPSVRVTLWQGAESYVVPCGHTQRIAVGAAPPLPWDILVRNAVTESAIAKHPLSDSPHHLGVIVRRDGVVFGSWPLAAGPASTGCK